MQRHLWALATMLILVACGGGDGQVAAESGTGGGATAGGSGIGAFGGAAQPGGSSGSPAGGGETGGAAGAAGNTSGTGGGGSAGSAASAGSAGTGGIPPTVCKDDCVFVRDGANGDGSDWENALDTLPASLTRGRTYLLAGGTYPQYTFDDAADGDTPIAIKKATSADHGTDIGWDDSYANGKAVLGPLKFVTPYYTLDGGPDRGIIVRGGFEGAVIRVSDDGHHVTLRFLELDGGFATGADGKHAEGACTGLLGNRVDHLTVEGCDIHDAADDGAQLGRMRSVTFRNNRVHRLHGCGTDAPCVGNCNNGHSDSLELVSVKQSVFEGNFLHHAKQTSTLFFSNYPDPSKTDWFNEDILFINNIFYSPETGLAAYICKAHNIRLYHNVIWGKRKNKYGGLGIAPYVTDLHMYNNIILSVNLSHMGAVFDPKEHHADNNLVGVDLGQFPLGPHDVVASDPKFDGVGDVDADDVPNPTVNDFLPVPGSPAINAGWAGDATHVMPQTDMLGNGRQGVPDLGALESSW